MLRVIGITVPVTRLTPVLLQNFKTPEKVLDCKAYHRCFVSDPQFRREMYILLGPEIVRGNKVRTLDLVYLLFYVNFF